MRYIPTSDETVERLKKQAKKLQRTGAGKHADLLNRVAKQSGYDHWHHVIQCHGRGKASHAITTLRAECEAIIVAELAGKVKIVVTGPEIGIGPFVLFSSGVGDAWLLNHEEQLGMRLVWQGERVELGLSEDPTRLEIEFDGHYELLGDFFSVETHVEGVGARAIGGYPLAELRPILDGARSSLMKFAEVMGQFDTVEMTEDVVARMMKKGYSEEELLSLKAEGYRYSPARDALLGPVMSSDDEDFAESD